MAIVIDETWLEQQGIEAAGQAAEELIDMVMDELEMRAGMAIADKLTEKQMTDFEAIEDEDARVEWLDKAVPEYPEIVEAKIEEIQGELTLSKDKIALIKKWSAA